MSATPVNGLSQFLVSFHEDEFAPGEAGYNAMAEFLGGETNTVDIMQLAQEMLDNRSRYTPEAFVSQQTQLINRVKMFDETLMNDKTSLTPAQRDRVHQNALNTIVFLERNVREIVEQPKRELSFNMKQLEATLKVLLNKEKLTSKEEFEERRGAFWTLANLFSSKPDVAKDLILEYVKTHQQSTSELKSKFFVKYLDVVNEYLVGSEALPKEGHAKIQRFVNDFETIFAELPEFAEINGIANTFSELIPVKTNQQVFNEIIQNGPDAIAAKRKTGGVRSVMGKNPYRIQEGYQELRGFLAKISLDDVNGLIESISTLKDRKALYDVLRRFKSVFNIAEGTKNTETQEIRAIKTNLRLMGLDTQMQLNNRK